MTTVTTPTSRSDIAPAAARSRRVLPRVAAAVLLAMFAPTAPLLITAWTSTMDAGTHLIHDVAHGTHGALIMMVALVAVLVGRGGTSAPLTLLATFVVPLPIALAGGLMTPQQAALPVVLMLAIALPNPSGGRILRDARPSAILLGMAALFAVPLGMFAADQLHIQASVPLTEPHGALGHWTGMAFWAVSTACLAVLAALRTPGWRFPLYTTAAAVVVVAGTSIVHAGMPSSFGVGGGLAMLAGVGLFAATAELLDRRRVGATV
jgi:hypothetical protein